MARVIFTFILLAGLLSAQRTPAQTAEATPDRGETSKATAYYHYAMGHLYAELAAAHGSRGEWLNKAIEHLRLAIKADPRAGFLSEELSDLYVQAGRLREAVLDAEEALRKNPDDTTARRLLGRIYTRLIGDTQQSRINEEMVKRALEQYRKISEKEPDDIDVWLMLGRLNKLSHNSVESEKAYKAALGLDAENEDALTGLAVVYGDLGDHTRASQMLEKVASKNPSLRSLTALATAYEQMQQYAEAASAIRRAMEFSPENADLKRALAQNLLMADKTEEALGVYQELARDEPKDPYAHLKLAQIYRQQRQVAKARESLNTAKELAPGNLEVLYTEVSLLESEDKTSEAIAVMQEILKTTEKTGYSAAERANRAIFIERLGLLHRANQQYEEAVQAFRMLGALDKSHIARSMALVAETSKQAKQFARAEQEAEEAFRKFPNERVVVVVRAMLLADLGRVEEGAASVRKLLDGKSDRDTYLSLAQVYEKGKQYGEVAKALDQAAKLSESDEDRETVHFMRGAMYERQKKLTEAEAEFRKALALNPDNPAVLNYLGYMLADANIRLEEARDLIIKALEFDPHNGAYLDSLGWVYFRLNNLKEAEAYLLRAAQKVSRDPVVRDHLGDLYYKQGRLKEAITEWQLSLQEWQASAPGERDPAETAKVQKKLEGARIRLAKEPATSPVKP